MALINHARQEINAKIVYCGPAGAGKATNLNFIYRRLKAEFRGSLKSLELQGDRMLYFDFMPPEQERINDYQVRFHVYTLTGPVTNTASWRMVLKGADGVIVVVDAAPERLAANREALQTLSESLRSSGKTLAALPSAIQLNKQDLAKAQSPEELAAAINHDRLPLVPAVAARGEGVLESLFQVVRMVMKMLRESGIDLAEGEQLPTSMVLPATGDEVVAPPAGGEASPVNRPEPLPSSASASLQPRTEAVSATRSPSLSVTLAGSVEAAGEGTVRLPLRVCCGDQEKRYTVTINISLDAIA